MKKNKVSVLGYRIGFTLFIIVTTTLLIIVTTVPAKQLFSPKPATISLIDDRIGTLESNETEISNHLDTLEKSKILPGTIIMWCGELGGEGNRHPVVNDITYWNWHVCDGTYPTPDLREKFIIGASDVYPVHSEGGSSSYRIRGDNLPMHRHGLNEPESGTSEVSDHFHNIHLGGYKRLWSGAFEGNEMTEYGAVDYGLMGYEINTMSGGSHEHSLYGYTENTGYAPAEPIETIPPYYSLVFLMYVEPM